MGNILDYLNTIENAKYGKDMKQAIHDGIKQCYDDGRAGSTDLEARMQLRTKAEKTELDVEKNERKREIAVERARIDGIVRLEDGSTTGDAELADIRIDVNGEEHGSAGESVRKQIGRLNETFDKYINNFLPGGVVNEFSGLSAVFLGDSQTASNYHKNKIWWQWVKEILRLKACTNYGKSGSTITNNGTNSMSVRYASMRDDADLIFIMGGVNDVWFNQPLGTFEDTQNTTFYGALHFLCKELKKKYPKKPIIFINATLENNEECNHISGIKVTEFSRAMKEVCYAEGILCLDAHGSLGINPLIDDSYTTDGLHLNDEGSELLGKWVAKQIKNNVVIQDSNRIFDFRQKAVKIKGLYNSNMFHLTQYVDLQNVIGLKNNANLVYTITIKTNNEFTELLIGNVYGVDEKFNLEKGYETLTAGKLQTKREINGDNITLSVSTYVTNLLNKKYMACPIALNIPVGTFIEIVDYYVFIDWVELKVGDIGGIFSEEKFEIIV